MNNLFQETSLRRGSDHVAGCDYKCIDRNQHRLTAVRVVRTPASDRQKLLQAAVLMCFSSGGLTGVCATELIGT